MEIKPQKTARRPMYAAALAAAASAAVLTGCGTAGDVTIAGDGPTPVAQQITVITDTTPDTTETTARATELILDGDMVVETERPPQVMGLIPPVTDPSDELQLEGEATVCPAYQNENESARLRGLMDADRLIAGFEKAGYSLAETDVWLNLPEMDLQAALLDKDANVMVLFYDGSADEYGEPCEGVLRRSLDGFEPAIRDWGAIAKVRDAVGEHRAVFVDINKYGEMTEEAAEKIANNVTEMIP